MTNYKVLVKDVIKQSDVVLEVLDARFPDETRNSEVERDVQRAGIPLIIVLNKCDLIPKGTLEDLKKRFSKFAPTVYVSSTTRVGTTKLRHKILAVANINKGDIMVGSLGYPNTGKSSVINAVAGGKKAPTSSISGHTKAIQFIKGGSRIKFIDTPGVIPFGENDENIQGLLSVKDSTHLGDPVEVASKIIERMCKDNKAALEACYNVTIADGLDSYDVLDLIAKATNCLKQKGELDERRAAVRLINEWQKGKLMI